MSEFLAKLSIVLCLIGIVCVIGSCTLRMIDPPTKPIVIDSKSPDDITPSNKTVINLPPGEKVLTVNWERNNTHGQIWVLTRPMEPGEVPQVYNYRYITGGGLLDSPVWEIHESEVIP